MSRFPFMAPALYSPLLKQFFSELETEAEVIFTPLTKLILARLKPVSIAWVDEDARDGDYL